MKQRLFSLISILILAAVMLCACEKEIPLYNVSNAATAELEQSEKHFGYCPYITAKEQADVIAIVKFTDELTNRNSTVKLDENGKAAEYYSMRTAEILKVYKSPEGFDESTVTIRDEAAAISNDGKIYKYYQDLREKDKEYIVFIKKTGNKGEYEFVNAENCAVDASELTGTAQNNLTYMFILDYETPEKNELVETLLSLEDTMREDGSITEYYPEQKIATNYGELTVIQGNTGIEGELFYYIYRTGSDDMVLIATDVFRYLKFNM